MTTSNRKSSVSRRSLLRTGAAGGVAALAVTGTEAKAQELWDRAADVVIIGAGVAGLAAAISALDNGASVLMVETNFDIGGHGMVSGGRIHLGGGHHLQQALGIEDNAELIYQAWTRHDHPECRYNDRDLVRVYADESLNTFHFLEENGVEFLPEPIGPEGGDDRPRQFRCKEWHVPSELMAPHRARNGSGLVRRLEQSARKKGAEILLRHTMKSIVREAPLSGKVLGITAVNDTDGTALRIQARKGVIVATGGHTANPIVRRTFDPRLTEEYQQTGGPYVYRTGDGEVAAMGIGAALWSTANQTTEGGAALVRHIHIGCQWGTGALRWETDSVIFHMARATGLTVRDWQDVILVNQLGRRFWDETDGSYDFFAAAMADHGAGDKRNGGGPIWAIFDADAAKREEWDPVPPNVDPDGFFASGETLDELAANIKSPYQKVAMSGTELRATVDRYNSFVDAGADADFGKPTPLHKIQTPPFYAAWATPMVHDSLTGLRTTPNAEVVDLRGQVIPALYCAGESQGGFAQHGLARCLVFGRVAGRHAAARSV